MPAVLHRMELEGASVAAQEQVRHWVEAEAARGGVSVPTAVPGAHGPPRPPTGPPPARPVGTVAGGGVGSAAGHPPLPAHLGVYVRAVRAGTPLEAVLQRMRSEGEPLDAQLAVRREVSCAPAPAPPGAAVAAAGAASATVGVAVAAMPAPAPRGAAATAAAAAAAVPDHLAPFVKAVRVGTPVEAVVQRMLVLGHSLDAVAQMRALLTAVPAPAPPGAAATAAGAASASVGVAAAAMPAPAPRGAAGTAADASVTVGVAAPVAAPSSRVGPGDALPAHLAQYVRALRVGSPLPAVLMRMRADGRTADDAAVVQRVAGVSPAPAVSAAVAAPRPVAPVPRPAVAAIAAAAAPAPAPAPTPAPLPEALARFAVMARRGLPVEAVLRRMAFEGLPDSAQAQVRQWLTPAASAAPVPPPPPAAAAPAPGPPSASPASRSSASSGVGAERAAARRGALSTLNSAIVQVRLCPLARMAALWSLSCPSRTRTHTLNLTDNSRVCSLGAIGGLG